jgi:plastocyanin
MATITKYKHEIMWWMSRITVMMVSLALSFTLAAKAYAAEITMGSGGNLVFNPSELTISAGDTVTVINGDLPPHNFVVADHPELSHSDLAFVGGETFDVTFPEAGDYEFQCEPHAGAGMKGTIHVQ